VDGATVLRLEDLSEIDIDMLRDELRAQGVDPAVLEVQPLPPDSPERAGDFGLTAVVIVIGLAAVKAVGAWMLKHRSRTVDESIIETYDGDGHLVRRETINHRSQTSSSPNAAELKALGELTNIDPALLKAV
jgi:hypothetical protein